MSEGWAGVLDLLEAEIDAVWAAPPTEDALPFLPPTGLGPVPPALQERAERLLGRMADLHDALEQRRNEVGRELSALSGGRTAAAATTAARPIPHFLDTTA